MVGRHVEEYPEISRTGNTRHSQKGTAFLLRNASEEIKDMDSDTDEW